MASFPERKRPRKDLQNCHGSVRLTGTSLNKALFQDEKIIIDEQNSHV